MPMRIQICLFVIALSGLTSLAIAQQQSLPNPWNQLKSPEVRAAVEKCGAAHSPWQAVERCILITVYNNSQFPHLRAIRTIH
jgi:hypothetical protein